ncbi:MAG: hypothetical protein Q4C00_03645 [Bacillota bacterium]|nr:hypothetical protein [Bacillota bacterium]
MDKIKKIVALVGIVGVFSLSLILYNHYSANDETADTNEAAEAIETVAVSTSYPERTMEEMIEESSLIIYGKVTAASDPFAIKPTNGGDAANFVDYTVTPQETYRSPGTVPETVTVRIKGGLVGNVNMVCENEPELALEDSYLFFLYQPGMGGGYNTEGDYYYVLGGENGVYSGVDTSGSSAGLSADTGATLDLSSFSEKCATLNSSEPARNDSMAEDFKSNMTQRLENGEITQEEYNSTLTEANTYAEIVTN